MDDEDHSGRWRKTSQAQEFFLQTITINYK
jgi:hypothetical protein